MCTKFAHTYIMGYATTDVILDVTKQHCLDWAKIDFFGTNG